MNVAVPHADAVGGDLMQAAQPLLLLGWPAPAALTARVALERTLIEVLRAAGRGDWIGEKHTIVQLVDWLQAAGFKHARYESRNVRLYSGLGNVAHGKPTTLFDAVRLVEMAGEEIATWRQILSEL